MHVTNQTTPMSMSAPNIVPVVTRFTKIGEVFQFTKTSFRMAFDLPRMQPSRREGWIV